MIITLQQLKDKRACEKQVELFKKLFGESVEVTLENCLLAASHELNFDWASGEFFTIAQRAAYEEAVALLLKDYEKAIAPLLKTYKEGRAKAFYEASLKKTFLEKLKEKLKMLWRGYV